MRGVLYADLLLPIIFYLAIKRINKVKVDYLFVSTFLIIYSILILLLSGQGDYTSTEAGVILTMRLSSFLILSIFSISYSREIRIAIIPALAVSGISTLIVSLVNFISGTKAYYGYVQILSTHSPSVSGFVTSLSFVILISLLFFSSTYTKKNVFLLALMFFLLALFTLSITAFVSTVSILIVILAYKLLNFTKAKSFVFILVLFALFASVITIYFDEILSTFYRLERIIPKLEYRLWKVNNISELMCDNLFCTLIGTGPGSHSVFNGYSLGASTFLSFDQLYGRVLIEYGLIGFCFFIYLFLRLFLFQYKIIFPAFLIALFGFLYGFSSEFIFASYTGSLFALISGVFSYQLSRNSK